MRNFRNPAIYFIAMALFALAACKKSSSGLTVQLNAADSNKTINIVNGERILITLVNPGDGGFSFDNWQYNSSVLKLVSHTHNTPANSDKIGDFGSDTWQFSALANGTSAMKITATRGSAYVITMFHDTIQVQ